MRRVLRLIIKGENRVYRELNPVPRNGVSGQRNGIGISGANEGAFAQLSMQLFIRKN
ncbi:hypothetical protein [Furfurilactobacillus milii]|uniref:hypothetical protein n=1 Tax=Furfurilactobacillus milii TaxID=2888272 RepID=UPI0013708F9E|nr:hypothetical protein [Furfurilactobacillus milii]